MRFSGFIGPSYTLQSVNVDAQRCVNLYPELDELGTGKEGEIASLVGTPGLKLLQTLGDGPVRGLYTVPSSGMLFAVSGSTLYSLDQFYNPTAIGTLQTSNGPVSMADNGLQLVIVDGPNGYYVNVGAGIAQVDTITVVTAISGHVYIGTVNGNAWSYTAISGDTIESVAIGIQAAINSLSALSGIVSASSVEAVVTVTGNSNGNTFIDLNAGSDPNYRIDGDTIVVQIATNGNVYTGTINGIAWSYTATALDTTTTIATAIASAINALPALSGIASASSAGNVVTVTGSDLTLAMDPNYAIANVTVAVPIGTSVLTQLTESDGFLGANQVTFQDGYFIFNDPSTQQFYLSDLNTISFNDGDVGSKEGLPDNIVGLISNQRFLFLFGSLSTEIWYDSGDTFPFTRVQGAFIPIGCMATFSIAILQDSVYWVGQDAQGRGIVYRTQGYQAQRISTHAVEHALSLLGVTSLSGARAWTYQQGGHGFYVLNFPGGTTSWVFDTATNLWHERSFLNFGDEQRHRGDCHAFAYSTNIVGDYQNGNLYALDPTTRTDNGNPIRWLRSSPHMTKELKRMFHAWFQLDMETGVGADGTNQGNNPVAVLQYSDDGGHTWSNEKSAFIGPIGAKKVRVIFRRLGVARDRVYRVMGSDPSKVTLLGADVGVLEGAD